MERVITIRVSEYTADHEEPVCHNCDNASTDCKCENFCGPEHGWAGYRRTEYLKVKEDDHDCKRT